MMAVSGMLSVQVDMRAKFNTITIIHNQSKNLPDILQAYSSQSYKPEIFVFVLDRCSDTSEEIINEFAKTNTVDIIINNDGDGFMAGYCRDLAWEKHNKYPAIFLDGDCSPSPYLFEEFAKAFYINNNGIVIASRNLETEFGGIEEDSRVSIPWLRDKIFSKDGNMIITNRGLSKPGMIIWSCCLGITPNAAINIINVNYDITRKKRIFSPTCDGLYGGEDTIVGLISMFLDMSILSIKPEHTVFHRWHPTNKKKDYQTTIDTMYNLLEEYAIKNNLPGVKYKDFDYSKFVFNFAFRNQKHI